VKVGAKDDDESSCRTELRADVKSDKQIQKEASNRRTVTIGVTTVEDDDVDVDIKVLILRSADRREQEREYGKRWRRQTWS
jgi:hypothetical protein